MDPAEATEVGLSGSPIAAAPPHRNDNQATWDSAHRRATFHLSVEVLDALAAAATEGRSKSAIVEESLRRTLKLTKGRRRRS